MSVIDDPAAQQSKIDWPLIEQECQKRWSDSKSFESAPDDARPKKFITVAYPYPNSPQHIGHGRTYTLADVHARFWRLRGYNVLFPMGFHYTGTPILGMARRVQDNDTEIISNLRDIYGVSESDIATFTDPLAIANYFHKEIKLGMKEMGYSIDWRREFTTIDPGYSKFIEWQITLLRRKGLIMRGSHPVGWCPKDQNPVSQHDTLGDVEPAFTEYVMIKFKTAGSDQYVIPVATLRPETVFGATNLWVNPNLTYKKITVLSDGSRWIVSSECAHKLGFLGKKMSLDGEIAGSTLVGQNVAVPYDDNIRIPILPASFVESETGTGTVMSVPAHAPYDWQALYDLARADDASSASLLAAKIRPITMIKTPGYDCSVPAAEAVSAIRDCKGQSDPRLEDVTKTLYSKEFYEGVIASDVPFAQFAGRPVRDVKDKVGAWLVGQGHAENLLEITDGPVRCRCGTECVVKILSDQWFLDYGDLQWKKSAHKCLDQMNILPDEIRQEFGHVVDWLHERACARQHGMGTKIPWDQDWIVESLSDSVIYMAYYLISRFVHDGTIKPEQMTPEFFDCVLLGKWGPDAAANYDVDNAANDANPAAADDGDAAVARWRAESKIPESALKMMQREFDYFYPVDYRHSGRDLVPNHLTFFVLNHVALFQAQKWPRGIVVNGSVLMDGSKMSKSMGNIIPLRKAIRKFGADPIRLAIIISAELLQDADFKMDSVHGMRARLEAMHSECVSLGSCTARRLDDSRGSGIEYDSVAAASAGTPDAAYAMFSQNNAGSPLPAEDSWILSRIAQITAAASDAMEKMRLREALHLVLFEAESALSWYAKRAAAKKRPALGTSSVLHAIMTVRVTLLQPFAPHVADLMWTSLGYTQKMWETHKWPQTTSMSTSQSVLQSEELLRSTIDDIASILKVTKITPSKITLYVSDDCSSSLADSQNFDHTSNTSLKRKIYGHILCAVADGETSMGQVMKRLVVVAPDAKKMPDFVQKSLKDILSEPVAVREARLESMENFAESAFLRSELPGIASAMFGGKLDVFSESDPDVYDPKSKARHARPFKPAILIE